jgi:hypothetical protein
MTHAGALQEWLVHALRLVVMAVLLGGAGGGAWSQPEQRPAEYQVKAAFLCKFGSFVEWPAQAFANPDSPFVLGVAATDDVAEALARTASSASVEGRRVSVRRLRPGDSLTGVHLLFIARSHEGQIAEWLAAAKTQPILTVTESARGAALGSTLNFVIVEDKVRFDVALPNEQGGLRLSSRLIAVARKVSTRGPS